MTYVKRVVMHGFKSFARRTEIPFENAMNVIVGPNGSGKSNITDALCFVLGRLSIKSIRAAKAANLLFSGNKMYKGSNEAFVEIVFDNSQKEFGLDSDEIVIRRTVRKNGLSIYKINNETKTRNELLELLSTAGIDPNGFNIILQGEIQSLVKSTPEERRKIIEEVAGISIYESRKKKSLHELEKTDEQLKEAGAVLRERNAHLRNLEKEKQEALSFQKLEETISKCKATLISRGIKEKEKEILEVDRLIDGFNKEIERARKTTAQKNSEIEDIKSRIEEIEDKVQISTNKEQEILNNEISDLKAELAGLEVRRENFERRISDGSNRINLFRSRIEKLQEEISKIETVSPSLSKQKEKHQFLKTKLDSLEEKRRKFYVLKSEVSTLENQKAERERLLIESKKEVSLIEQSIESMFGEIKHGKSIDSLKKLKQETKEKIDRARLEMETIEHETLEIEKKNAVHEIDIKRESKLREEITGLKFCYVCKQEVTESHKHSISETAEKRIENARQELDKNLEKGKANLEKSENLKKILNELSRKINEIEVDMIKIQNSEEKKERIKKISEMQSRLKIDLISINERLNKERMELSKLKGVEEEYDESRMELSEISFVDIDVGSEVSIKNREQNRIETDTKAIMRDLEDSKVELKRINSIMEEKQKNLETKNIEIEKLYNKFKKLFEEKTELSDSQKAIETGVIGLTHDIKNLEDKINSQKIDKAKILAQNESLQSEIKAFGEFEPINASIDEIKDRLQKAQFRISQIGSVNMRALEVFETVEQQCKMITDRIQNIESEKEKIMGIVAEIDKKKRKSFVNTLESLNQFFTRNFSQLSKKGEVFLELENQKEPFEGGLNILVRVGRGKYFDVASLSGGEKTLVALSLIFAIQEYKPYHFYILDEIDAALDKHNSELLAALIKKYMTSGQYIIITHNDTLISEATTLYGVSMQDNISKIVSLKV